jgi:hypothetical protein
LPGLLEILDRGDFFRFKENARGTANNIPSIKETRELRKTGISSRMIKPKEILQVFDRFKTIKVRKTAKTRMNIIKRFI